ncbi:hypothetical protein SORBI_3002G066901, partial [Sorghum bicolor]
KYRIRSEPPRRFGCARSCLSLFGIWGFDWFLRVRVEKENLCLYGHPNGGWEVSLPVEEVLSEMPEPALKINFARDGMKRRDWLSLIAVYSDAWVISVAFFFAAKLNANNRLDFTPSKTKLF